MRTFRESSTSRRVRFAAFPPVITLAVLASGLAPFAAVRAEEEAPSGLRVYHIGNSHTHSVRNVLMPLAHAVGHTDHDYSWSSILGAPLRWIRDHDEQSGGWEAEPWSKGLAPDRAWDALTLQAYATDEKEIEAAVFFAGLALRGNPKCRVYLYTIWPAATDDWDAPQAGRTEALTEQCAARIATAHPNAPRPRVIPSSLVVRELGRLADAGELPHVPNRFALLSDGGHLSDLGSYAVNVTICAMLYGESPLDYPNVIPRFSRQSLEEKAVDLESVQYAIPEDTAAAIRRVVWDVLATYPPAGVDAGLAIADRRLPPAILGRPYQHVLRALHAAGRTRWSLAEGALPAGLTLSAEGLLAGTPRVAGDFPLKVRTESGGRQFARPLKLSVRRDEPPRIAARPLPGSRMDEYLFVPLAAAGGVGRLTWSLAEGQLPHGLMLMQPGIVVGTPGESGRFDFTVQVADAHPDGPRSDRRRFEWHIEKAAPETLFVPRVDAAPKVDGKLDEPCWSNFQPIAKPVIGDEGKRGSFAAVWTRRDRQGTRDCLYLAIRVEDGPEGRTPRDAVHLFLDARHNREVVYNADDTHFRIDREGRKRSIRGKPDWFLQAAAQEVEDGYVLEVALPGGNYFIGNGAWVPFDAKAAYGLDIAIDRGDGTLHRVVWRGTERNEDDTSGFGTMVLTGAAE